LGYKLAISMVLGTKRSTILALFLTAIVALVGSLLGIAMGTAGAQAVSTAFRWVRLGIYMAPFMEAEQALHTPLYPSWPSPLQLWATRVLP
jgi:ABC-type dipeptide/oligopeptide/nickel transport system permease subunit